MAISQAVQKQAYEPPRAPQVQCFYCGNTAMTRHGNKPLCREHFDNGFLVDCKQWLLDRKVVNLDMTDSQRMKAMADYRERIARDGFLKRIEQ